MRSSQSMTSGSKSISWKAIATCLLVGSQTTSAITLDTTSTTSITAAVEVAANGLVAWYNGNQTGQTPGLLPSPYYWWEAGAMWMSLVDYWYYTGDTQYNNITSTAIQFQRGDNNDFMTTNQTKDEGNDDQSFWGFAAMEAAELNFPAPPSGSPSWLALAQGVFNVQAARWDTSSCAGGLKWQIYPFNTGYNYKNGISNGCFFNMAARLYRYTGNETYADWAVKMYDWCDRVGIVSDSYQVFDGTDDTENCTSMNHEQWTYNAGVFLYGAAMMWNKTSDTIWKTRVDGFVAGLPVFFKDSIMYEAECEPTSNCDNDQQSFKAYLSRWMAGTTLLAPWTYDTIMNTYLVPSAKAAAEQCSGGTSGTTCGLHWTANSTYDGMYGPGEQMAAMQVMGSLLVGAKEAPYTASTGGTSISDPTAGTSGTTSLTSAQGIQTITKGDRAGAGVLTAVVLLSFLGMAVWSLI